MTAAAGHPRHVLTARRLIVEAAIGLLAVAAIGWACSYVGVAPLSAAVWKLRLLRLAAAAVVGLSLAVAGTALQALLRNPLANPYLLGVSSGAGVGVLLGMGFAPAIGLAAWATTPLLAVIGALVTCLAVYLVAQRRGRLDPYALLLSGVIVNAFNGAITLSLYLFVKPYVVVGFARWAMGELTYSIDWPLLAVCAGASVAGAAWLLGRGASFNAMSLGDEVAGTIGVPVGRLRIETFVVVSLMTAGAVALAGPIGFVGLIIPHVCRLVVGADHRRLVLVSAFVGAGFLMAVDTLCRTAGLWIGVGTIPTGIVTALAGGPFFLYLLRKRFAEVPA